MTPQQIEKLEILDGSRRKDTRRRAAVRIEDLAAMMQIPPAMIASKAAGATPTKAEFDALVEDVARLRKQLLAVVASLQGRLS